jgi:hypothetical protein
LLLTKMAFSWSVCPFMFSFTWVALSLSNISKSYSHCQVCILSNHKTLHTLASPQWYIVVGPKSWFLSF